MFKKPLERMKEHNRGILTQVHQSLNTLSDGHTHTVSAWPRLLQHYYNVTNSQQANPIQKKLIHI